MSDHSILMLCGLHSFGFAAFHLAFWSLFRWPKTLASTTLANRAILQIAGPALALGVVCIAILVLLAACGQGGRDGARETALGAAGPLPRGGGRIMVGPPYWVGHRIFAPQFDPGYDRIGVASWIGFEHHAVLV